MKIALILGGQGDGGLERHVLTLANQLASRHSVTLFAHRSFAERLTTAVHFEPVDMERSRLNPVTLWQLTRRLRALRPDIIHAHANKAAAMIRLISRFVPGRRVATIHNLKQQTGMFRRFDHVIAVSRGIAAQLNRLTVDVIYNGVPLPTVDAAAVASFRASWGPGPVVAAIGRLVPAKGFDLLLQAWAGLPATLLIVGDGPERGVLEELVQKQGLSQRVHFLGQRTDVPVIIRAVDCVVIASRREGFPLLLCEVLLARQLVIATAVPGVAEVLPPSLLVPVNDVSALQSKLRETLAEPAAAQTWCEPAWQFAREELTLDQMVRRTEEVYYRATGFSR